MMSAWCGWCGDEFEPVEYRPASLDPDEPDFCSDLCEEESAEDGEAYDGAGWPAPVW